MNTELPTLAERCQRIELLLLDVDGVLTDGSIIYGAQQEIKAFHVRDGSALKLWHRAGKRAGIITGRQSDIVTRRAAELDIGIVWQGQADKWQAYRAILAETQCAPMQVAYVGDDWPDLPVLLDCGLALAPRDACPEVRGRVHQVLPAGGGHGAVREAIALILAAQGIWHQLLATFLTPGGGQ